MSQIHLCVCGPEFGCMSPPKRSNLIIQFTSKLKSWLSREDRDESFLSDEGRVPPNTDQIASRNEPICSG